MSFFKGFDLEDFWRDSDYARQEYVLPPPTDISIAAVEKKLGYKLPGAYVELMRHQNGGLPKRTAFPTTEPTCWAEDHVAINGILGIGDAGSYSLCGGLGSQFMMDEWGYPPIGIYFGDCPSAGHDMICLDYRKCGPAGEPEVVHVDQENDYKITHLAGCFESFIRGLVDDEEFSDEEEDGSSKFVWRPELMTATIKRDDEFLRIGQYLHLEQNLPSGEAGWLDTKINVPEHWDVQKIEVRDGAVRIDTAESGSFCVTEENAGVLFLVLSPSAADRPDYMLQVLWVEHAGTTE